MSATEECTPNGSSDSAKSKQNMDGGWAWMVLVAACLHHMLCEGTLSSLGVFIVAWQKQFPGSLTKLTWIASLVVGVTHMAGKQSL